jgi:hypothetical protein
MSDEMSATKEAELKQQQEVDENAEKEVQDRLEVVIVARDPKTGQTNLQTNANVKTTAQTLSVLDGGVRQIELSEQAQMQTKVMARVLKSLLERREGKKIIGA